MHRTLIALALAVCMLTGVAGSRQARPHGEGWREIPWPFPRDGWPAGRAFRCANALCGNDVEVYVRPKAGFCNCYNGVADDDEIDRFADLDLIGEGFVAQDAGRVVHV